MAIVNHAKREINAKIVYYGSEGVGKTTSLRYVYDRIKPSLRGEFKTLPASGSSLLFFDFSPFEQPVFAGYRLRLHVYTLQGKVTNSAAWKMTLKGTDGLMIVADTSREGINRLQQSVMQVRDFFSAYGMGLDTVPSVLQLNKADLAGGLDPQVVAREAGVTDLGASLTTAITGEGVLEAVTTLSRMVMEKIREREDLAQEKFSAVGTGGGEKMSSPEVEEITTSVDSEIVKPAAQDDGQANPGIPLVSVAPNSIVAEGSTVRIPLDLSWNGTNQRLVVTVVVAAEQVKHDAC